ncbi:unnamed protein product [Rotaria sp. Silwood2]|nr:unnamed protein product [Rotaria sp. Silwood2]CAF3551523.1 unnamed protein product [Rotaria sp. Silwood2]CAF4645626.1 unnamed protein product [Rotaria sp. Silwood2]CAF4647111.1 unnamed protein product [Rotaria sp. Silwood2]CAF4800778.1 unnamed protein product [Rotaria sp. Silwood2]
MTQQLPSNRSERFVNSGIKELQEANRNPIYGYQHLPVLPLEETLQSVVTLIPGLMVYIALAKENCYQQQTTLTLDESAAIYLYTMGTPFYSCLNKLLRTENRNNLKPWFSFLKLFISALDKLPSLVINVWRGVVGDAASAFIGDSEHTWWSVNSCSRNPEVVKMYLGETSTLFTIDAIEGKDITLYSNFSQEEEVILKPGTRLRVKVQPLNYLDRLLIVPLQEKYKNR